MDKITAPYTFAPLSEHVFFPDWAARATQDWPFKDGLSGVLEYEVEALGPIFVRGDEVDPGGKRVWRFFRTPDGQPAIPGSTIRGLLRNVVQIASFGKFGPINDHRYGIRDLQNGRLYIRHMSAIEPAPRGSRGEGTLVPLVSAGWLRITGDVDDDGGDAAEPVAEIQPCSFAKLEYGYLKLLAPGFDPGKKQSAPRKYDWYARSRGSLEVGVKITPKGNQLRRERGLIGDFGIVDGLNGTTAATIVFTGQPQEYAPQRIQRRGGGNPKHNDFVFHAEAGAPIKVTRKQFRDFEFIHSDRGQQSRRRAAPNEEWAFWKTQAAGGKRVPVFFLLHQDGETRGKLRSFGLAMMFRLAYERSVGEAADLQQPGRGRNEPDLAETVFGRVADKPERGTTLKGRVSVGLARLVAGTATEATTVIEAVLGAPKASYYPNYIEQGDTGTVGDDPPNGKDGKPEYKTLQDDKARLRGWKRYRPQEAMKTPPIPEAARNNDKVKSRFLPIGAGARFKGHLRLHNVRPVELGALLWAIDFGGEGGAEHMIGMARSYGYGRARLSVTGVELRKNEGLGPTDSGVLETARAAFLTWAREVAADAQVAGGWDGSAPIQMLLAAAKPLPPGSTDGYHLDLYHPVDRNQFTKAKLEGLALPPPRPWRVPAGGASSGVLTKKLPLDVGRDLVVAADLTYLPGTGEWKGRSVLDGKPIELIGKANAITGITPEQTKKKQIKQARCKFELIGGNRYRIIAVLP
jgi:CRISPR-associated protein (TIGR03986 family)